MELDRTNESWPDNGRILIADDEPAFARPLAELFRREGFEAEAVFDGTSAAARLKEGAFEPPHRRHQHAG